MSIKPYDGKFKKLKHATNVDAFRAMGFNSTYIGLWGTFYRLNNEPFTDGIQIKVTDDGSTKLEAEEVRYNDTNENPSAITYGKAVSIISKLPYVMSTANQIAKVSNGIVKPKLVPGNKNGRETIDGESYFSVHLIEDHGDHIVTIDEFLVSLNGENIFIWDTASEQYKRVNMILSKHQTLPSSVPAEEAPFAEKQSNVEVQESIINSPEVSAESIGIE